MPNSKRRHKKINFFIVKFKIRKKSELYLISKFKQPNQQQQSVRDV